ncbi:hypothetical protein GCM10023317_12890 [Actinopolymorpha pittospori]
MTVVLTTYAGGIPQASETYPQANHFNVSDGHLTLFDSKASGKVMGAYPPGHWLRVSRDEEAKLSKV